MSYDSAQLINDPEEASRIMLDGQQAGIWTAFPGIVVSVNFTEMTCQVQPAIQGVIVDPAGKQSTVNLPVLVDVPIVFPGTAGFLITLPLAKDDEVLVIIASRCIDAWWQLGGVQVPLESRMHDLSDGFAIPAQMSQPKVATIGAVSTTAIQIRNKTGDAYLGLTNAGILQLVNTANTMKGVLNGMLTLLSNLETALATFSTAMGTAATFGQVNTAAGALSGSITSLQAAIVTYQNTTIPGVFQ